MQRSLRSVQVLGLILLLLLGLTACQASAVIETDTHESSPARSESSAASSLAETETSKGDAQMAALPTLTLETSLDGKALEDIVIELYPDKAPNTVNSFIKLVQDGFYDGLIFHRIIPNFMIQGGDPDGLGTGGPGFGIKGEFKKNGVDNDLSHERGVISMARSGMPDSAGSQFFICHADASFLDGDYAGFGKMLSGFDALDALANTPTGANDRPQGEAKILSITVDLNGYEAAEPERIH